MSWPDFKLEIAFATTDPYAAQPVWTDISSRLKSVQWMHERQRELDVPSAASSSIVVDTSDRAFEIGYAGSPYYPNVKPDKRVRLSVSIAGGAYQTLFVHYIDDIDTRWQNQADDVAVITAMDAFSLFALADIQGTLWKNSATARLNAILDLVGWPKADRNIQTGGNVMPTATFKFTDNAVALALIQLTADSMPGSVWVDNLGRVSTQSPGILPFSIGFGGIDVIGVDARDPRSSVFNVGKFTCSDPALAAGVQNSSSVAQHKKRVLTKTVSCMDLTTLQNIAGFFIFRYAWPVPTFDQLIVQGATDNSFRLQAAVDLSSTGNLVRHQETGADFSQPIIVNGFSHQVNIGSQLWTTNMRGVVTTSQGPAA